MVKDHHLTRNTYARAGKTLGLGKQEAETADPEISPLICESPAGGLQGCLMLI